MGSGDVWFFDRIARVYNVIMPAADAGALRAGLARGDRSIERVLDVGGGTGRGLRALDPREPIVLDAAGGMLDHAPAGWTRLQASATAVPLADDTVDAVVIVDALHHLPDATGVLAETYRVLRGRGVVVIREFDPETVRGRLVAAGERVLGFSSTFMRPDALATSLETAGFDATIVERGFGYTVAGRKPRRQ